jgi:hypothetical protein
MISSICTDSPLPYRLRIGVTGHRELGDSVAVAKAVDRLLNDLETALRDSDRRFSDGLDTRAGIRRWIGMCELRVISLLWPKLLRQRFMSQESSPTPIEWTVYSALAKGADRIVAQAVLHRSSPVGPPKLRAILPLPLEEYRHDFATFEDREEFDSLLSLDLEPTVVEADRSCLPSEPKTGHSLARNDAYFDAGRRVVDECNFLIAIWNGEPGAGPGGTADVVRYAVEEGRSVFWIDSTQPGLPIRVINRVKGDEQLASGESVTCGLVYRPLRGNEDLIDEDFRALAYYNHDPMFDAARYQEIGTKTESELLSAAIKAGLPEDVVRKAWLQILPCYLHADVLAIVYEELYVSAAKWLHCLSALAVTVGVMQWCFGLPAEIIILEILAMGLALCLLFVGRTEQWHEKWLRDRHFAERLRMLLFTSITDPPIQRAAHAGLPFYRQPERWVVEATERIATRARAAMPIQLPFEQLRAFITASWLDEQIEFHHETAERRHVAAHSAHKLGTYFFVGTLVMAVLHFFGVGHVHHHEAGASGNAWLGNTITALAIVLPAWGAAMHSIGSLLDHERIAERSHRMAELLEDLAARIRQTSNSAELAHEVRYAAELMMNENHEWRASLSFRGLVLPA